MSPTGRKQSLDPFFYFKCFRKGRHRVPATDTNKKQTASRPKTDRYGIVLGQPHPDFEQVRDLARELGVKIEQDGKLWTMTGFDRKVCYYAHNRCVRLENDEMGNREGDFAIAITLVLTGKYPLTNDELRLSRTIRHMLYK
ncbi:MAG: hypothetical protein V4519_02765 [Patescibacteria group bacterium]